MERVKVGLGKVKVRVRIVFFKSCGIHEVIRSIEMSRLADVYYLVD